MVIANDNTHSNELLDIDCNLHVLDISWAYLLIWSIC